jgi:hypothetical protein
MTSHEWLALAYAALARRDGKSAVTPYFWLGAEAERV